jgi:signal peptidase I
MKMKEKKHNKAKIIGYIKEYASLFIVVFLVTGSLIQGSLVPTPSMESTIMTGDRLMINKAAYELTTPRYIPFTDIELPNVRLAQWGNPKHGDPVVFIFPGNRDEIKNARIDNYVKRCIAVPGDKLEIINKVVFINGIQAHIPANVQYINKQIKPAGYAEPDIFPKGSSYNSDNYGPIVIPKKNDVINLTVENIDKWDTFINREFDKNVVEVNNGKIFIDGKETNQYTVTDDYYFMMGDNRDNSLDSRYWGFVPRRNVVGKPLFVYFSWNSDIPFSDFLELIKSIRLDRLCKIIN